MHLTRRREFIIPGGRWTNTKWASWLKIWNDARSGIRGPNPIGAGLGPTKDFQLGTEPGLKILDQKYHLKHVQKALLASGSKISEQMSFKRKSGLKFAFILYFVCNASVVSRTIFSRVSSWSRIFDPFTVVCILLLYNEKVDICINPIEVLECTRILTGDLTVIN